MLPLWFDMNARVWLHAQHVLLDNVVAMMRMVSGRAGMNSGPSLSKEVSRMASWLAAFSRISSRPMAKSS